MFLPFHIHFETKVLTFHTPFKTNFYLYTPKNCTWESKKLSPPTATRRTTLSSPWSVGCAAEKNCEGADLIGRLIFREGKREAWEETILFEAAMIPFGPYVYYVRRGGHMWVLLMRDMLRTRDLDMRAKKNISNMWKEWEGGRDSQVTARWCGQGKKGLRERERIHNILRIIPTPSLLFARRRDCVWYVCVWGGRCGYFNSALMGVTVKNCGMPHHRQERERDSLFEN